LRRLLAAFVLLLVLAGVARAEDPSAGEIAPVESADVTPAYPRPPELFGPRPGPPLEIHLLGERDFRAGLHDFQGSVAVSRDGFTLESGLPSPRPTLLGISFSAEESSYDFHGAWGVIDVTDDPVETVWQIGLAPRLLVPVRDDLSLFFFGSVDFRGAIDAEVEDALTYGGALGVRAQLSPDLTVLVGFGGRTRLEARPLLLPYLGFDWKVSDRVRLELGATGLKASFEPVTGVSLFASFGVEQREYRLAQHGDDALVPGMVVRDLRVPFRVGAGWQVIPGLRLEADCGVIVYQRYVFDDHLGRIITAATTNPAGFVGFNVRFDL
jgi:hypothetical protein